MIPAAFMRWAGMQEQERAARLWYNGRITVRRDRIRAVEECVRMPNGNHSVKIGLWGAPYAAPSNTMASFRAAYACGCDWVLCATRSCADGTIVLTNSETVRDGSGRTWDISCCETADLAFLNLGNGQGVATLMEMVAWAAGRVGVIASVAPHSDVPVLLEVVEALCPLPRARKMVCTDDLDTASRLRSLCPDLPLLLHLTDAAAVREAGQLAGRPEAVALEAARLTTERVERFHADGSRIFAWAADDWETARAAAEAGADALVTRRPEALSDL